MPGEIHRAINGMVHVAALVLSREVHRAPVALAPLIQKALTKELGGLKKGGFDAALDNAVEVVKTRVRQGLD